MSRAGTVRWSASEWLGLAACWVRWDGEGWTLYWQVWQA